MLKSPWLSKALAVLASMLLIAIALARIDHLVAERESHQRQATLSVQQSLAGAQTLLGPLLLRECSEHWVQYSGDGKQRMAQPQRSDWLLQAAPETLEVDGTVSIEPRQRGLFKVNTHSSQLVLKAGWPDLTALQVSAQHPGSTLNCKPPVLWLAGTDVRGLRSATVSLHTPGTPNAPEQAARAGTQHPRHPRGLHVLLDEALLGAPGAPGAPGTPLVATLKLDLVGSGELALVPAADSVRMTLRSAWPHPSFGGSFLPQQREVNDQGFTATWRVSALASNAAREALGEGRLCAMPTGDTKCLDSLSVAFIDPVNPYSLADRAVKYGLLFVVLTFVAMGLAEALAAHRVRRVHPIQYALVGLALALFFLLLLSLSEHIGFGAGYAVAASAVVLLLGFYARHMLGGWRDGLALGTGVALLYGLLFVLLQREQTALVLGSVGLFLALASVMWATRRLDWYGLAAAPRAGASGAHQTGAAT